MAILLMFFAGIFISFSNLCMRKSIDKGGTTKGFLIFQMTMACFVAFLLNPVRTGNYSFNAPILLFGALAGLVLASMVFSLGRALEKGPPGFTFSALNGATVMPAIVMACFFGASRGYPYTGWHAVGSALVLLGLFWAGRGIQGIQDRKGWIAFVATMFSLHVFLLVLFQWRALLLNLPHPEEITAFLSFEEIRSQWFMPTMFFVAAVVQLFAFLRYEKRKPQPLETLYGLVGGAANGLCTYFMIWATEVASPLENAVIYPIFSVVTIVLSNLWGQKLYEEEVNWKACQLCACGLVVGTIDWRALAAAIGF